mmetsp:Transcript_26049/g.21943  ORF Transcript_26049/g.21943 Transcript_26049/m.21943 type:complete len:82 (+) Transcript_26049:236-481(+)
MNTCAILNSRLKCLGINNLLQSTVPLSLSNKKFSTVTTDTVHTCAILATKNFLYCWGSNRFGESTIPPTVTNSYDMVQLGL